MSRWLIDVEPKQILVPTTVGANSLVDALLKWGFSFKAIDMEDDLSGPILLHDQGDPQHNHAGEPE